MEKNTDNKKEGIIEIFTLEGNISKKSIFSNEDEVNQLMQSCFGAFFYKIIRNGVVVENSRICYE